MTVKNPHANTITHQLKKSSDGMIDTLSFGNLTSEQAHGLTATDSDSVIGGLGEPARRFLPLVLQTWEGGQATFTMKVDPVKPNYVTARFWGGEANPDRLILFVEGKQIGFRPMGDVDNLDIGSEEPMYNGRFYYSTSPLPMELTQGKTSVECEIRSSGFIWVYGTTFDKYQRPMTVPTRGIYRIYTHTEPYFVPLSSDKQGVAPPRSLIRTSPGLEVLDAAKATVNVQIEKLLASTKPLNQMEIVFLARAWNVKWSEAYQNPSVVSKALASLDEIYLLYIKNPVLAQSDPLTPNADWFGLGPSGQTIMILAPALAARLDDSIDDGKGGQIKRRAAYSQMLVACRDWHRKHRRLYSNQTMINDLYGIYLANRGVEVVDPAAALSEPEVRRYLYESVGLERWRDSDPGGSGAQEVQGRNWGVGGDYWEVTDKGLTRELGYVGNYGEVLNWVSSIYKATAPSFGQHGDPRIREQLVKMARTRAIFRYPATDTDGYAAMRLETVIGWRDTHYPGDVTYGQRPDWDGSAFNVAAATLDPHLVGYAQQMLVDNQFFASVAVQMQTHDLRAITGLLDTVDDYDAIVKAAPSPSRLPMTPGQPDFVFTDEQDGVVAVKHGDETFFASLYWRAHKGLNNLARIHDIRSSWYTIATVPETCQFTPSGLTYVRPDNVNPGFGIANIPYPGLHSVNSGETLQIAKIPDDIDFKPGQDNVYAGKADFYQLHYGPYFIAMNMTKDKTFTVTVPHGGQVTELTSGKAGLIHGKLQKVAPRTTVVYYVSEFK